MPGAIRWAAQVLSPGGGLSTAARARGILLVRISLPDFSGSQADGGGALVMVASLTAVVGSFGPHHPVHNRGIRLALFR